MMSAEPPGANPTTMRMGLAPSSCASTGPVNARPHAHASEKAIAEFLFMRLSI